MVLGITVYLLLFRSSSYSPAFAESLEGAFFFDSGSVFGQSEPQRYSRGPPGMLLPSKSLWISI